MADSFGSLVEEHHAFYEVSPYYVVLEEKHEAARCDRRVQAGFDVDVYGVRTEDNELAMPVRLPSTRLAIPSCKRLPKSFRSHCDDSCSLEVIQFPSRRLHRSSTSRQSGSNASASEFHIAGVSINRRDHRNNVRLRKWKKNSRAWVSHDDDKRNMELAWT